MITGFFKDYKTITQVDYDREVNCLDLFCIVCSCGHSGCLTRHAYYKRKVKTRTGTTTLRILRVKCRECGRTHALLPDLVVPYSQLSVDVQQSALLHSLGSHPLEELMSSNPDITESDVSRIRSNFLHHWEQRLKSIPAILTCGLKQLRKLCYFAFHRQFMQIRRGIYLWIRPTHTA